MQYISTNSRLELLIADYQLNSNNNYSRIVFNNSIILIKTKSRLAFCFPLMV